MVEFEDSFSERMAQLEQEDFERYQRDIQRNSSNSYADENPSYDDEFQSKLSVLLDMVRSCINDLQRTPYSTVNGYEPSAMNIQPDSFINDVAIGNRSETTDEHPDEVMVVSDLPDSAEIMNLSGIQGKSGNDSSNSEEMVDLEETVVSESASIFQFSVNPSFHKQLTIMDSDLNSEKFYVTKIDSEVHRNENNGSIYEQISERKEVADVVLQVFDEMPKTTLVDPNEESSDYKASMPLFDYVPFILCHSFDPGGAYLSPTAFNDTLCGKYARNDKSKLLEIYVEEPVEGFEQQSPWKLEGLEVVEKLQSPPSIGIFEKYIEARDSGSNSDCYTDVVDQINLKERTTMLLDKLLVRVPVENHDDVISVPVFAGYCFVWNLSTNKLLLNTPSLNHLGSPEYGESCVGECKDDVVFIDDALFLFDPGGSLMYYRDSDPFEINQEKGDSCYIITVDDAFVRFDEYNNDALGVDGGFKIIVEYESMLIWGDRSDTEELVLMVHDRCIPRKLVYASDEKIQASATISGYHKWNINGNLLVVNAASSVLSSCVAWHNIDVVTQITPSVFCDKVIQQLMFSVKAYSTTALLKDRYSLWEMVDRVVIIQASISLSYSYQLGEQVQFYIIMSNSELRSSYVVLSMLAGVVWDPGQDDIPFYIIEDNDVLKSKGIGIQLALVYSLVKWSFCSLLLISSSKFEIRNLYKLMELLVRCVGYYLIDPNGVKQDAECRKTLHITSLNGGTSCAVDKMLKSEPNGVFAGLKQFPGIRYTNRAKKFVLAELRMVKVAYKVFDEMPELNYIGPFEERNGNDDLIPLIDYVRRVFDSGTSKSLGIHNELFRPSIISTTGLKSVSGQCHSFATLLGQRKAVLSFTSNHMVFIFDPGGCGEIVWFWTKGVFGLLYCQSHECLVLCMGSHITSLVDEMKRAYMGNDMGKEYSVSSILPTWQDDKHPSCLVECSRDPVTVTIPLYLDEAWFFVKAGNYDIPMISVEWFKSTLFWIEVSCQLDHVAMQIAQMLSLIGYNGYYYVMGSYNITALENACHMNTYQTSVVVHTNVMQGAAMSKVFVWDPGFYHFTTLRTRRFLRGRSCHELRPEIRNNTEDASVTIKYLLLAVSCVIWFSSDVIASYMSYFIIMRIPTYCSRAIYKLDIYIKAI